MVPLLTSRCHQSAQLKIKLLNVPYLFRIFLQNAGLGFPLFLLNAVSGADGWAIVVGGSRKQRQVKWEMREEEETIRKVPELRSGTSPRQGLHAL